MEWKEMCWLHTYIGFEKGDVILVEGAGILLILEIVFMFSSHLFDRFEFYTAHKPRLLYNSVKCSNLHHQIKIFPFFSSSN